MKFFHKKGVDLSVNETKIKLKKSTINGCKRAFKLTFPLPNKSVHGMNGDLMTNSV